LPRQPLGDQRSGDAAADDQRVAFQVFGYIDAAALPGVRKPWRAAAAQVGLLGVVGFEGINRTPFCSPYGAQRNTGFMGGSQPPDFAEFIIGRAFARPVGSIQATGAFSLTAGPL
jgi:hypothetical protein